MAPPNRRSGPREGAAGDFYSPFFDIIFYRPGGELPEKAEIVSGEDLLRSENFGASGLQISSANGNTQTFTVNGELKDIRNVRASLTIDMVASAAVKATLTLNPPYFDGLDIIDGLLISFGSLMEIQWGYNNVNGGEPIISDKGLFHISEPTIKFGEQIQIQVVGWDMLYSAASSLERRCSYPRETFKTDLDIINTVVQKHHGETVEINTDGVRPESLLRKQKTGQPVVQSTDDYTFFRRILSANSAVFTISGSTLIIKDEEAFAAQKPSYRLLYYQKPSKQTDVPMISFSANSIPSLFGSAGSRGFLIFNHDPDKNEVMQNAAAPEDSGGHEDTNRTLAQERGFTKEAFKVGDRTIQLFGEKDNECAAGQIIVKPNERPNQQAEGDQKARMKRNTANTHAEAVVPGLPGLSPLQLVEVVGEKNIGVGEKFGGVYRVMKVSHQIGQGYTSKLSLLRSSTSGNPRASQPAASGGTNTQGAGDSPAEDETSARLAEDPAAGG